MRQKFKRVSRHLYRRQYENAAGDWATLYYARFVCRLKKKRRLFALGADLKTAKDELKKLEAKDVDRYDFDVDRQRVETKKECDGKSAPFTLNEWAERYPTFDDVKRKRSLADDLRMIRLHLKPFFGSYLLTNIEREALSGYRWDREIEPAVVRVPHGLFGSTGGGSESDPLPDSEGSGRLIDADEGPKRHRIRVVDHQEQPELRGVRQFIGPVGIIGRRNDVSPWCNLPGPQVNIDHPASTVSHEEPGECGYDSVGTATIAAAGGSTDGSGHDSGERRANGNLRDKCRRLGVDDVNGHIRTIGEVVGLGRLVDETDIKGVQLAIRGIRGGPGDRNRLEQSDGAIIILSPSGQRKVAGQQHTRGDRHRQSREPEIFPEYGAQHTVLLKAHKKSCEIFHNPSSFQNSLFCFKKPVCGKCSSVA